MRRKIPLHPLIWLGRGAPLQLRLTSTFHPTARSSFFMISTREGSADATGR